MNIFTKGSTLLLLLGDVFVFLGALILMLAIRYGVPPPQSMVDEHLTPFLILFCVWVLVFLITGLYDRRLFLARKQLPMKVLRVQIFNMLFAGVFFFSIPFGIAPKTNLAIYLGISTVLIIIWRLFIFPRLTDEKSMNLLIVGDSEEAKAIARVFVSNPYFKNVSAFALASSDMHDAKEMKESLLLFVKQKGVDMIVADMRDPYTKGLAKDFYKLVFEKESIQFYDLASMYEELHHRILPSLIGEEWILQNVRGGSPHYAYDFLKRTIDIVGAIALLIPCAVVFPLIILAIKLQDGGAIFYHAQRRGQFNKPIRILKFRTMTGMDDGITTTDTKFVVTSVGKFLRKTRLDELPQLVNVLKGDLSFIGPRPEMPSLADVYADEIPYFNLRHLIKPGLSGWAQLYGKHGHGEVAIEETRDKLSYDLYYLKHRSIFLDIEIALKTINTLLMRSGT